MSETAGTSERSFPPLYKSTGDPSVDRLAFFHILERLKTQKRTGWVRNNVSLPLSISDHMYRMSVLALCSSDSNLDIAKCVMMCVVHDLAEAQVGDIAPHEGISKAEKHRMEEEAMHSFIHGMLHNTPAAQRIESLYKEYEAGETPEAQFVKGRTLQPFFDSAALPKLRHPEVKGWGEDLLHERDGLFPLDSTHQSQIE
ncbi:hd domain-containing protein [Moniliophthora roreri MCA 2997]|uniref:Hd domain-containing protein n=1 Tax=Moniliophthora roreri (strain MCA 2997) TaxID=1381753 RepID=V2X7S8_MONRO|nr:hd domain-containing protein [Moniliophthora roreri MCA 2997]